MEYSKEINEFAEELGEHEDKPLRDLKQVLDYLGVEAARELLDVAKEIEAQGGMRTADGSRRRTLGGVFFKLARDHMPARPTPRPARRLTWPEAADAGHQAQTQRGEATTVKITLIGRPGKVINRGSVVVTTMYNHKRPSLPKQLPKLPGADVETRYTVFIAAKQWRKVTEALEDKEDVLIIEGYPFLSPDIEGICVFARSTTTKLMQRALREKQRATSE